MSKLINSAVTVNTADGVPVSLFYKRHYSISHVQEHWRECGQWWLDEPELHVYKAVVVDKGLWEPHHRPEPDTWILYRVQD